MACLFRLCRDRTGAAAVEFAMVAPVFFMLLFGVLELGHMAYVQTVLNGAVQEAGRNGGLESGRDNLSAIDARVSAQVRNIAPKATVVSERKNYQSFFDVGTPEDFTDANGNGAYDGGECFTDANGNGEWDADRSKSGLGGADDVSLYTATVTYERPMPLWKLIGWNQTNTLTAKTILRNQPYGDQDQRAEVLVCP